MSPKRNHSLELHYRSNSRNCCGGEIAVVLLHGRSRMIAFIRRLGCILGVKVSIGGFNMGASITLLEEAYEALRVIKICVLEKNNQPIELEEARDGRSSESSLSRGS
ncbi:hypothetical protein P8452_14215 [Trifolium repens]|nr:hypothetical protein P8452_14215 [Trifolium repens]